jgi:hypothetical protein
MKKKSADNTMIMYPVLIDGRFAGPLGECWAGYLSGGHDILHQIMGERMRKGCLSVLGSKAVAYSGKLSHESQTVT